MTPAAYAARFDGEVRDLVVAAAAGSPGFAARLREVGVAPDAVGDVGALERIPVLTKDDLLALQQAAPPFGDLLATDARPVRIYQSPGPLYEPEFDHPDPWRWGEALAAAGFGPDDVVLVTFGYHLSPAGAMFERACASLGATVVPGGTGNKDLQVRACHDLGVTAFIGVPSYLHALLDAGREAGMPLAIERAFVSAEPLPRELRRDLEADVAVVRQGYGTAEAGNLGYECEEAAGLHVPSDALVQIVDLQTGEAIVDDREGQVVVTLLDRSYPLVRFGTGDLSAWAEGECPCGRETPRLRGWLGRVGDAVKVRGMFLHPQQVASVLSRVPVVHAYHLVVDREDHRDVLTCEVVPSDPEAARDTVAERVGSAIRDGLRFSAEVVVVDEIAPDVPPFEDRRTWETD